MPASWVKNEAMWKRAKEIVKEQYPEFSETGSEKDRFFALVTTLYKKLCASPKHDCEDFSESIRLVEALDEMLEAKKDAPDYRRASGKMKCGNCIFAGPDRLCRRFDFTFEQGFVCDAWKPKDRILFHTGYVGRAHKHKNNGNGANGNGGNGNGNGEAPPPTNGS